MASAGAETTPHAPDESAAAGPHEAAPYREVRYEYSPNLAPTAGPARRLPAGLHLSGGQARRRRRRRTANSPSRSTTSSGPWAWPSGPTGIAVGARAQVWFLRARPDLAPALEPAGRHDACFLTRTSHFTGEIQGHELAWAGDELWAGQHGLLLPLHARRAAQLRAPLAAAVRLRAGARGPLPPQRPGHGSTAGPRYVTAFAETDTPRGWRPTKATGGCLIDVPSGETVARGFAMPHSPRVHRGRVWLLDSGTGRLVAVDPATGRRGDGGRAARLSRGAWPCTAATPSSACRRSARPRPSAACRSPTRRDELKCGVGVVDLGTGRLVAHLEFVIGVEEIFDVQVLPGVRCPAISGPHPGLDGAAADLGGPRAGTGRQEGEK